MQSNLERSKLGSVLQCPEQPCRPKLQLKAVEQMFLGVTEKSVQWARLIFVRLKYRERDN